MTDEGDEAPHPADESPDDEPDGGEPDSEELLRPVLPPDWVASNIGKQYSELYGSIAKSLLGGLTPPNTANWFPHIKTTDLLLPQLKLPVSALDSALQQMGRHFVGTLGGQVFSSLNALLVQQVQQWGPLFETLRALTERFLPPNWKDVKHPDFKTIEAILLDEGIPLAWIPNPDVLQALFNAPDAAARRRIIGRRWHRVVSDCEVALSEVSQPTLQRHQPFARDVVQALRAGHVSAAQALAANLLDSILRRNFDKKSFKSVTTNKKDGDRFDLDDYRAKATFTLAPIWRAYAEYWENQGDPVPRVFGRHPSAHAVSRTQYSRVNAVIGLMLVTSLLKLLDSELAR
jgi:hypothetical protein